MPSRYRTKLKASKEYYAEAATAKKQNAKKLYEKNKEKVKHRTANRKLTDKTGSKKSAAVTRKKREEDLVKCDENRTRSKMYMSHRRQTDEAYRLRDRAMARLRTKQRLLENEAYREENRTRSRVRTKQRLLENEAYREDNRARSRVRTKRLLKNEAYREADRARSRVQTKQRLLENDIYREENRARSRVQTKQRLLENDAYRQRNCSRARLSAQRRWSEDMRYRRQCIERAKSIRKARLQQKGKYWKQDCNAAAIRKRRKLAESSEYRKHHNIQVARNWRKRSHGNHNQSQFHQIQHRKDKQSQYSPRQLYWIRRRRMLSLARRQQLRLNRQKKMQSESSVFLLDIKLLFAKAEKGIATGFRKIQALHKVLSDKIVTCLDKMSVDINPSETDIAAVFDDVRIHTAASEPYFSEQVYRMVSPEFPIPIDTCGKARLFTPREKPNKKSQQSETDNNEDTMSWYCNPDICNINDDMITGTVTLLRQISTATSVRCLTLYTDLNQCQNPNRTDSLGHPLNCTLHCNCSSLLRPARLLSCHFPLLRNIIHKVYELRRIAIAVRSVEHAMANGSFVTLKTALQHLTDVLYRPTTTDDNTDATAEHVPDTEQSYIQDRSDVSEEQVLSEHGKALRLVVSKRDAYSTQACDVCEQMKANLLPLRSYEHRKGFTSQKMTDIIDLLYIHKTKHESVDEFLDNTFICSFCADKLRGNKDVARSAFNRLSVIPTPPCIQQLNIFEKSLIRQCMTSISVVRLGQVSNKNRPSTELNSALKGRIAYLPVDVASNATFLPENLFNVDSLVLLVGAQPTSKQKVWSSVVDLNKVHTALAWLKEHNPLYKDIPVYTVDDIRNIINDKLAGNDTSATTNTSGGLLKKLDEATKTFLYEHFTIQPLSAEYPADAIIDYQLQKINGQSINIFDSNLDLMAFPDLFPTGCNGIKDTVRDVKIGTSEYIKSRLLNKDAKFRLNISYLFHCFQTQEVSNMCHSVGHMLRTVTGRNLTAKELHDRLEARDGEIQSKLFTLLANLRGSKEYFAKLAMDIQWMIKQLGPPTLFITCSTAEWFSESLIEHIKNLNRDCVPNVDNMTPAELCALDPVTVSIHFHKKWQSIFTHLINSKETPLFGTVADHFWRIEYQQRGSAHVHCVLWIKDAPVIGKSTAEEVQQYIDKVITCARPDPTTSPTLSQLVSKFQVHRCNSYCQKSYKHNGQFFKKCRFGFPRPVKNTTELNDPLDCLALLKTKQPRKRLYHLHRTQDELKINDYNPALLLANQANVDVQYIGHLGSRLPYYITEYMTKHERSEQDQMWQDIFSCSKSLGTNAMAFLLKSVKSRQVGANEAADRLLGHKLYSKSRQMRFADLEPAANAKRVLKPATEISRLLKTNPECEDIFLPHWVLDIYPARPDKMEDVSLHELLGWYEREKVTNKKQELQLKGYGMYLRRRTTKPYIITHKTINPQQSEEKKESYFYQLLKLFKPWRKEDDLCPPGKSFSETYELQKHCLPQMQQYHEGNVRRNQDEEQMDREIADRSDDITNAQTDADAIDDHEGAFAGCRTDPLRSAMQEITDSHHKAKHQDSTSSEQLSADYNQLNADQKRVIDKVVTSVCSNCEPLHLIVSGQGGTGKSRVIELISRIVTHKMPATFLPVVLAAPTGLAAFNIGGTTIHRLLSLPVEHGKPANYSRLQQEQLVLLKATLKGLKLLILDEVSMVSSLTLLFIHMRLTEIMCCNELFGGVSVVFFGDFLQLPPVKGNQPFMAVTFLEAKQRLGAIASIDVWQQFSYDELTINMRQTGDKVYADLLTDLRVGRLSEDNYKLLQERLITPGGRATVASICDIYNKLANDGQSPIILMPRTNLCEEVNTAMLNELGTTIHNLTAIDTLDTIVDRRLMNKVKQAYNRSDEDVTRTAGLEKHLKLCIGSKVMLKRNKDVDAGLVNGSIGKVTGFNTTTRGTTTLVQSISVQFENLQTTVNIERDSASFEVLNAVYYTRKQFPLMLAFAITTHKSQGLSLCTAIVDAGSTNFGPGMVYVGLSRVTSLTGLHLIDLDKSKIACDHKAVNEYNRLRRLYAPHLGDLRAEVTTGRTTTCVNETRKQTQKRKRDQSEDDTRLDKKKNLHAADTAQQTAMTTDQQHQTASDTHADTNDTHHQVVDDASLKTFDYHQSNSLDETFQTNTCSRLNLQLYPAEESVMSPLQASVARLLERHIYNHTAIRTSVHITTISGDGNCLFRALSHALTRSQRQHDVIRMYVTNYMTAPGVAEKLQQMFSGDATHAHTSHVLSMQQMGQWGTDQEVAAAAHLLRCSIVCFSSYSGDQFCLQHFSPHLIDLTPCHASCNHQTIYLINSSGSHYESAVVRNADNQVQEE